ncbi:MAG TPA: formimidoylglutamate deiminase [Terrimesophilobacter sp.]|nr:formimidoylglutamate deiminase [Terrimesophilobacter sp.]
MSAQQANATFHAELAWLGGDEPAANVLIEVADGVISRVSANVDASAGAHRLRGLTLPGLANTHSHVFHRAIRGRSQSGVADFWSWRTLMYGVAERLDPESLYALAHATYAEMALSGITSVGEFFYLHHDQGGKKYANPNEMGDVVVRAANDAGLRITLIDTCYLQADVHGAPLDGVQRRFDDGSWEAWASRVDLLKDTDTMRVGAAIHSVRAVPRAALAPVADYAASRKLPLHVHLSEQPAENEASLEAFGITPTQLLAAEGALGGRTTAVHATHLTEEDIRLLGSSGTTISMCCTTERDLADGVGPASRLAAAGSPIVVGSDAHMAIDLFEEARAIELDERLISGVRGHFQVPELAKAITSAGAASLGWNAGRIEVGALADLVTVVLDSPRTAGARGGDPLAHVIFAATGSDVDTVIVGGELVVDEGRHRTVDAVGPALESAINAVFD